MFSFASQREEREPIKDIGCCTRLHVELNPCQPWFHVTDPTNQKISIPESFGPYGWLAFLWKLSLLGITVFTVIWGFLEGDASFYFCDFSNLSVLLAALYAIMSFINTIASHHIKQPEKAASRNIKLTWILFELAAHSCLVASALYWCLIHDGGITYLTLASNGVVMVLVWFDGLMANRVPVRWMHWSGAILPFNVIYVLWTVIYALPKASDSAEDDLCPFLEWGQDQRNSILWATIFVLIASPVAYMVLWLCSLHSMPCRCSGDRRFYIPQPKVGQEKKIKTTEKDETDRESDGDFERGDMFCGCFRM